MNLKWPLMLGSSSNHLIHWSSWPLLMTNLWGQDGSTKHTWCPASAWALMRPQFHGSSSLTLMPLNSFPHFTIDFFFHTIKISFLSEKKKAHFLLHWEKWGRWAGCYPCKLLSVSTLSTEVFILMPFCLTSLFSHFLFHKMANRER